MNAKDSVTVSHPTTLRLDAFVLKAFPHFGSRSQAKKQIKKGLVLLNGKQVETSRRPSVGDRIEVFIEPPRVSPLKKKLNIHLLDSEIAVVFKPAGLYTSGNHNQTLRRALAYNIPKSNQTDALPSPEPCHRLDRRVSGLVLCARTHSALTDIHNQFKSGTIQKKYFGIVLGKIKSGFCDDPIENKPSYTAWQDLETSPSQLAGHLTLLEIRPKTGRTHQIRRHLTACGHPLLGDDLYHDGRIRRGKGLFLMSAGLEFRHPMRRQTVVCSIPVSEKFQKTIFRERMRFNRINNGSQ